MPVPLPDLAGWQWLLGAFSAFMIGVAKTGAPGVGSLISPVMVITIGDARLAAAWMQPLLSTGDFISLYYWWRYTEARRLFSLIPWVLRESWRDGPRWARVSCFCAAWWRA